MEQGIDALRQERQPLHQKLVKVLWTLFALSIIGVIGFFVALSFSDLPSLEELENPKSELATEVYGSTGVVFGRYYVENRIPVSYDELSPHLVQALVATEDERFYQHSGIDFRALNRVLVKTVLLRQSSAGGASTLTQQLAKLLFTPHRGSGLERVLQKFKEWIIALRLERRYTKEEIIAMYLNKFNFINGAYGIKAASEIYFAKGQDSLTVDEAATLVGMLKNPSLYNPKRRLKETEGRRNVVLFQMKKNNLLTEEEYQLYRSKPLDMTNFKRTDHSEGLAPYFRAVLGEDLKKLFNKKEYYKPNGKPYDIYRDGLKVYTTIDPTIQAHAEKTLNKHMAQLQKSFFEHWKKKDPWTYREDETTDREIEIRQQNLRRLIENSDRYEALRPKYLDAIIDTLTNEIKDLRLWDADIKRILEEDKKKGHLTRLIDRNMISASRAAKYRRVLKSKNFQELKKQWNGLQERIDEVFDTPTKMTVFAYNDRMETDTTMSPLDSIRYHRMFMQLGSLAVDPKTGQVKAWVGGVNHKYFKFDHVRSRRQVGSTFKPFIYSTAIALQGFSPCFKVDDMPYTIHPGESSFDVIDEWTPNNANGRYTYERFTLRDALRKSINSITVYMMKQIGSTESVLGLVHNMGIDTSKHYPNGRYVVPRQPAIALGATDLTVYEMAGAYTTFANNGTYNKPTFITRIEDKNGRVIYAEMPEERQVLNPRWNYVMVDMLKHVNSTASGFWKLKTETGGKTGTTNSYVDGWYMGITPNLVVGTWVGGDDRWIRFRNLALGQGGKMARPFFLDLMLALEADEDLDWDTEARFHRPPGDLGVELNCSRYEQIDTDGALDSDGGLMFDDMFGDEEFQIDSTELDLNF